MAKSLAEQVALLPPHERDEILASLDPDALRWDASFWLRPEQQPPDDLLWAVWLYLAGRGAGKTRAAAEWVRDQARQTPHNPSNPLRFALVARTASDVRDVLIQGESGILSISPPSEMPTYQPSLRKLTWPNGNQALAFTADEPDQLRGPQFHYAWADEAAAWRQMPDAAGMTAWDNLRVATRLPNHASPPTPPRIIVTTTPKRVALMRALLKEAAAPGSLVRVTRGRTADNVGNLPESYVDSMYGLYAGTRMARQELDGEMLDDADGALWTESIIESSRSTVIPLRTPLKIVGVDPTVAESPGDECGIVVVAATADKDLYRRQAWVLEDQTVKGSPETWAQRVVHTARRWRAPVVAETNQGGALVRQALNAIDPAVPVYEVHSRHGKKLRAEPVALAYEQGRVHHLGTLADLETQMTQWLPEETRKSPDRIDALVHALTALLVSPPKGFYSAPLRATSPAQARIPSARAAARPSASRSGSRGGARVYIPR
jgi:phage terminase large subunit-like protein